MRGLRSFAAVAAIAAMQGANAQNSTTAGTASASAAASAAPSVEGSSASQGSSSGVSSSDTSAVYQDQGGNAEAPFVHPEGAFVFQNGSAVTNGQVADAVRNNGSLTENVYIVQSGTQGAETHPVYGIRPTLTQGQNPRITDLGPNNTTPFEVYYGDGTLGLINPNSTSMYNPHPRISDIPMNTTFFDFVNGTLSYGQTYPAYDNTSTKTQHPNIIDIATGNAYPTYYQNATSATAQNPRITDVGTGNIPSVVYETLVQNATLVRTLNPLISDIMTGGASMVTQIVNGTLTQTIQIPTQGQVINGTILFGTATRDIPDSSEQATITRPQNPLITDLVYNSTVVNQQTSYVTQVTELITHGQGLTTVITQSNGQQLTVVQTQTVGQQSQNFGTGSQIVEIPGQTIVQQQTLVSNNTIVRTQVPQASTVETRVIGGSTQSGGQIIGGSTVVETRPVSQQTQQAFTVETRVVGGSTQSGGQVVGGTTIVQSGSQAIQTQAVNSPMNPGASFSQAPFGNATAQAPVGAQSQPAPEIPRTQELVRQTTLSGGPVMEMTDGQIFEERTTAPPFIVQETPASTPFTTILGGTTLSSELVIPESTLPGGEIVSATTMQPGEVLSGTTAVIAPGPVTEVLIGGTTMTEASFLPEQTLPNGEIILATSLVPGDVVFQTTIPVLSSSPTPELQIDLPVTAPEIYQAAPSVGNGNPQSPAVGAPLRDATEVAQPSAGSSQIPEHGAQLSSGTPQIPVPFAQPASGSPLHETFPGAVATPQIPSSPQASLPAQPAQSAPAQPQSPFDNATIPAVEQVPPQGAPGVQVPEQAQPSLPFSNPTVPSFGSPQENVSPSIPGQPIVNVPSNGTIPVVPGQQTPQQPQGVAQPSTPQYSQPPVVGGPSSNTTVPSPGRPQENAVPEHPVQNIPSNGTNSIVPVQANPASDGTLPIPGQGSSSGSSPRPEQPITNPASNETLPIPGQGSPSTSSSRPEQPIMNPASNGTLPIPGQGSPSESSPRPEQPITNPASNGTLPIPGQGSPSTSSSRPEQPILNPVSNGTLPIPVVPNMQPEGYNPVMQLPDGQIQNRPLEGMPTNPGNNSTQSSGVEGQGSVPSTSSTPFSPSNNATSTAETPVAQNSTGSNRVPVEGGEGGAANPSRAPTGSSGTKLVKGGGSAFAAAVAMLVMAVV